MRVGLEAVCESVKVALAVGGFGFHERRSSSRASQRLMISLSAVVSRKRQSSRASLRQGKQNRPDESGSSFAWSIARRNVCLSQRSVAAARLTLIRLFGVCGFMVEVYESELQFFFSETRYIERVS